MSTLVLVEHNNQQLHPATRNTLSAALELGDKITLLVVGYQCRSVAEEAASLEGAHAVLHVDNPCYEHQLAEAVSDLVVSFANSFSAILAPSSTYGKNILPRVAAQLDVTQISDVSKIINSDTFQHPVYAGNAIETVRVLDSLKVITIRTTAFDPITSSKEVCCIESIDKEFQAKGSQFVRHELSKSERPDLGSAKIVVSGGRGLQNAEKFKLIEELADTLGAAVGASRAAVDAGFVPNDYQVGQTGKVVAPMLYIAVGISGAVQHLAGMKDSKVIVAINKDADAPIFQIATYGVVGDLFELVPQLIEQLKNR
ncbi:TPA: electron transfer flavoprotein subunit alpha [Legionella pneumophila]|uniref:electron transfer flavoprotein subunit alpha/FixB family protein n=1 Tax=Legionella sp. PATHC039 TaxID=2992042 RepID=UPI0007782F67|nr:MULTISPECIES: FAD-binding protein [Legionella]HAT8858839.1 electron transfer flavoprotein subunit alpha [Legionella pneumophila subsp. pneumophila]MCW8395445.1 FAD-binding protein [Legionella sp. PATHC039]HAT7072091.1 electron transfer flavoprotein subunit alpha [Legionella pneumophila]HAT8642052.1 electron transfer flavoprotein subunit alpha [Legionella pneumophila]HAT8867918.1 electron transfer flavoprotein subunit alpha [Legionella pneumophila subsp. pneumophila]